MGVIGVTGLALLSLGLSMGNESVSWVLPSCRMCTTSDGFMMHICKVAAGSDFMTDGVYHRRGLICLCSSPTLYNSYFIYSQDTLV